MELCRDDRSPPSAACDEAMPMDVAECTPAFLDGPRQAFELGPPRQERGDALWIEALVVDEWLQSGRQHGLQDPCAW